MSRKPCPVTGKDHEWTAHGNPFRFCTNGCGGTDAPQPSPEEGAFDGECFNPAHAAPLLPGVSASECREVAYSVEEAGMTAAAERLIASADRCFRAAAILRSVADAIDKGGEP